MIRMINVFYTASPKKNSRLLAGWIFSFSHCRKRLLLAHHLLVPALLANTYSLPTFANKSTTLTDGIYLGGRLSYSYNHHSCVDMAIECDRTDAAYGIFTGYDFNNNFSLELSGTKLGDTHVIYPNITLKGELSTVDLSLKYTRPLSQNIQAFGKLGIAYWDGKITGWETILTDSGNRPVVGAGIQLPFFTRSQARLEYHYFDQLGNNWMGYTDSHLVSFSVVWNFSSAD